MVCAVLALFAACPKTVNGNLSVDLGNISDATKWTATQYEDLGINNSDGKRIYWGVSNLGASATYPYGYYFSYGQVQGFPIQGTFGNYTCEHKFSDDKLSDSEFANRLDSGGNLKPEYDAAHIALGGAWRIPTRDEMMQLHQNTNKAAVAADSESAGITYTSIKSGYEDKRVFLPAAGHIYVQTPETQGTHLLYLTSSSRTHTQGIAIERLAVRIIDPNFTSTSVNYYTHGYLQGFPIRPVFTLQ